MHGYSNDRNEYRFRSNVRHGYWCRVRLAPRHLSEHETVYPDVGTAGPLIKPARGSSKSDGANAFTAVFAECGDASYIERNLFARFFPHLAGAGGRGPRNGKIAYDPEGPPPTSSWRPSRFTAGQVNNKRNARGARLTGRLSPRRRRKRRCIVANGVGLVSGRQ